MKYERMQRLAIFSINWVIMLHDSKEDKSFYPVYIILYS